MNGSTTLANAAGTNVQACSLTTSYLQGHTMLPKLLRITLLGVRTQIINQAHI